MILSDLNYLEIVDQETGIVGGRGVQTNSDIRKRKDLAVRNRIDIDKRVNARANFNGNFAFVEGTADARGRDTFTEIEGGTQTEENRSSESFLDSVSISR
jgi:hypothetical protein